MAGVAAAIACPILIWHDLIDRLVSSFSLDPAYLLTAWTGFALMAVGVLAVLPVALTAGGNPAGRFHPRRRNTLAGWGASFYLMGLGLVVQLGAIAANF